MGNAGEILRVLQNWGSGRGGKGLVGWGRNRSNTPSTRNLPPRRVYMKTGLSIRSATSADAAAVAAIYAPYVGKTAVSFEFAPPDAAEMARRIEATLAAGFPWVVAERSGAVAGYAYAGPFRKRAAYAPSAELSVYVAEAAHGQGIGRALVEAVEDACRARGNANLLACVAAAPEPGDPYLTGASLRFHERLGFAPCARLHACARKFGRWYDIVFLEKRLDGHPASQPKGDTP